MEMQASRPLAVSQQQAWEALNDPAILKACLAGCDRFEPQGDGRYAVGMTVQAGPLPVRFTGQLRLSDPRPPESCRIVFEGEAGEAGEAGAVKGQADVHLGPEPGGHCLLGYRVQAEVGGQIARLGPHLLDAAAKGMADGFFARFDALMQEHQRHAAMASLPDEDGHIEPTVDAQAWEHDAAGAVATPLDAAPASEAEARARRAIPLWCWALAVALVLGAGWLLSRY